MTKWLGTLSGLGRSFEEAADTAFTIVRWGWIVGFARFLAAETSSPVLILLH